jgi:hypothetical protein
MADLRFTPLRTWDREASSAAAIEADEHPQIHPTADPQNRQPE